MTAAPQPPARDDSTRARRWPLFWAGLAVGAFFLVATGSLTDVDEQVAMLRGLDAAGWAWVLLAFSMEVPHIGMRAARWSMLFPTPRLEMRRMVAAMAIGYLYNNVIPRSGEFVRMVLVGRWIPRLGVPGVAVTIGADRVVDVIMVVCMTVGVVLFTPFGLADLPRGRETFAGVLAAVTVVILGLIVVVRYARAFEEWVIRRYARLPERPARWLEGITRTVFSALEGLGQLGPAARRGLVFWTLLEYGLVLVVYQLTALPFGIDLALHESAFIVAASGYGAMVPSGPGNFGSMLFAITVAAKMTSVAPAAGAYAVLTFGAYFVMRTVMGLAFLVAETRRGAAPVSVAAAEPG